MNNWYESAEGYWGKLEKNKEIIREWMRFHPCISTLTADLNSKKTAVGAEIACRQIRNQIKKEREEIDPYKLFDLYLKNKDPRIGQLLNEAWFGVPESSSVRSYQGFSLFCDLCSEAYILQEQI